MGMRIKTNVNSLIAQRHLVNNNNDLEKSLERLSSGHRINQSKDDSAGLAVSESMRAKIRGLNQAKRNANDSVSMLQVAEGGLSEMSNLLVRMRELTVQSSTDTIGPDDRRYLNREYVQLASEIDRIAATSEFNGNKFFVENKDNPVTQYTIQVGANGTKPEDNIDTISINLQGLRFRTEDLGIGKLEEIGPIDGVGPTRDEIATKLNILDTSLNRMANERATIGAIQSRMASTINNLGVSVENLNSARSRIVDTDYAEETAMMTQSRILTQGNLSTLAQANQMPEMALSLLR